MGENPVHIQKGDERILIGETLFQKPRAMRFMKPKNYNPMCIPYCTLSVLRNPNG